MIDRCHDIVHPPPFRIAGPPEEVAERVKAEFKYQSGMELSNETFELVRHVTPAHEIIRHARQRMVQRLNAYSREHTDLFKQVLDLINQDFLHILQRQALAGKAIIRSNSPLLGECRHPPAWREPPPPLPPPPLPAALLTTGSSSQNPRSASIWCWMFLRSVGTT